MYRNIKNLFNEVNIKDIVVLIILYIISARIGQLVAISPGNVTPFWPAAGVILCALLIKGYRIWPGIWIGAIIGNGWAYADFSSMGSTIDFLLAANLNGAGDTLCALLGYFAITNKSTTESFLFKENSIFIFILYAVIIGSIVSATFGVVGLCLSDILPWEEFWYTWLTWAIGDGVGIVVVTPVIMSLYYGASLLNNIKRTITEKIIFLLLTSLYVTIGFTYDNSSQLSNYLITYSVFPILIYASFRYGCRMAFILVALISFIAISITAFNIGNFIGSSVNESLIHLQMFIGIITITTLFLNAVIYQRKKAEDSLRKSKEKLEEINNDLESFSYSISHDLRAPLRSIDGFSKIITEDYSNQLDETANNYLDRICMAANRMGVLIDDLLMFSRTSRKPLFKVNVDLSFHANEILKRLTADASPRKFDISIQPNLIINADENLIVIVFENLISNAIKFTGLNSLSKIEIGLRKINNKNVIFIKDNGVGFDMKFGGKIFEVFQRLHNTKDFVGTGIGLSIVQKIIKRHEGSIWAESELGESATFYLYFPD